MLVHAMDGHSNTRSEAQKCITPKFSRYFPDAAILFSFNIEVPMMMSLMNET